MVDRLARDPQVGCAVCGDLGEAERRGWWIASGLGGSFGGRDPEGDHGLTIAPVDPPLGRRMPLGAIESP